MNIHDTPAPTLEEIWRLFKETARQFEEIALESKEIACRFKETDLQFKEIALESKETARRFEEIALESKETARRFEEIALESKETARRFEEIALESKETDRLFKEIALESKETDRRFKETDRKFKETDKKIGELGNRLGEFVEGLIKPSVVRLFQERGILVHKTFSDVSADNPELDLATQIGLLLINGEICVLIEVKSKLSIDDINEHIERMNKFKPLFPEYADKNVYGAVAAMVIPDEVSKYAYRKGFFVIAQKGEITAILNDDKFKPATW
ncbi:hypothetical protein [Thioflexithrix psekupsensis]|uniref:DUF3782 domain-containing protein n=1 Tax=Thioflexithrix psekupsensis TaxID=1570016 RepID=A0A251X403_9GAMM|nr:hypothetical protein [Thioflexithrix psekupsensis]OUD12116.1 hypothetical protein TPSD3_13390 [Thioflexithrix psekupsensis]